jgi:phosphate transport system substrate-binding protein
MRALSRLMLVAVTVLVLMAQTHLAPATELKISGAAAVAGGVINPHKAAIEQETGLTLNVIANGDANGLKDLNAGKTDAMMVAAPLKATAAAINKATPDTVTTDGIEFAPIGATMIHFVVNPANPVKMLSAEQIKDIFTGKITNWKEVGGADQPILVVAEVPGLGTRTNVVAGALGGADITPNARTMQALVQVAQVVGQVPNAIGYGNAASITSAVAVIPGVEVKQPLGFATKGAPNADVQKLIAVSSKFAAAAN